MTLMTEGTGENRSEIALALIVHCGMYAQYRKVKGHKMYKAKETRKMISIRESVWQKLKYKAKRNQRTVGHYVVKVLEEHVNAYRGNPDESGEGEENREQQMGI